MMELNKDKDLKMKHIRHILIGQAISRSGIFGRLFGYVFYYVPFAAIITFGLLLGGFKDLIKNFGIPGNELSFIIIAFVIPALPFIIVEWRIRSWRKNTIFLRTKTFSKNWPK